MPSQIQKDSHRLRIVGLDVTSGLLDVALKALENVVW